MSDYQPKIQEIELICKKKPYFSHYILNGKKGDILTRQIKKKGTLLFMVELVASALLSPHPVVMVLQQLSGTSMVWLAVDIKGEGVVRV